MSDKSRKHQLQLMAVLTVLLVAIKSSTMPPLWSLVEHWAAFLWWGIIVFAGWGQAAWLMGRLANESWAADPILRNSLTVGLGLGLISLEAFLVGLAGFYTTPGLTLFVVLLFLASLPLLRNIKGTRLFSPGQHLPELSTGTLLPLVLVVLGVLLTLLLSLVPPVFFDTMTYHLELPSRYLQEGRIFHVAENLYSGYPQLTEILYGLGLAVEGVALPGLFSVTFLVLLAAMLWGWGRAKFGSGGTAWGLAILVLLPPFMINVGFLENGWVTAFFTLAPLVILSDGERSVRSMVLAGIMAGLAAGCKYNVLAFGIMLPIAAGVGEDLLNRQLRVKPWSIFLASSLTVASPWYIKNFLFTGDPLYPLIAGMTGKVPGLGILAADTHLHPISWSYLWDWIAVPYLMVFNPWEVQLAMSPGLLPVILLPALWTLRRTRLAGRFVGLWALGFLVIWYISFRSGRFLLPVVALACLYLGAGFDRASSPGGGWGKAMRAVVCAMLLLNIGTVLAFEEGYAYRSGAAFGIVEDEEYLEKYYPLYPALSFLNELDPPSGKVLFLGEMKGFYSRFDREVSTFEVPNRLIEMIRKGTGGSQIAADLGSDGFTHILYNSLEMKRLAAKSPFLRINDEEAIKLSRFFSTNTRAVFNSEGIYVFEIGK